VGCYCYRVPGHELRRQGRFVGTRVIGMDDQFSKIATSKLISPCRQWSSKIGVSL
jgi:hypothetical protein